jgi:hypothetical protein
MLATPRDSKLVDAIEKLTDQPIRRRKIEGLEIREEHKHPHGHRRSDHRESSRDRKPKPHATHAPANTAPSPAKHEPVRPHQPAAVSKHISAPRRENPPRRGTEHETPDPSHLPAFQLRPVKLPPVTEKPARKPKKATAPA